MATKLFESPVRTMIECETIDGILRIFVGQIDVPILVIPGERLILRPEGQGFVIEHEARS